VKRIIEVDAQGNKVVTREGPRPGAYRWHYIVEEADRLSDGRMPIVLLTGGGMGPIQCGSGTVYDCDPDVVIVHPDDHDDVRRGIHQEHHRRGNFLDVPVPDSYED